MRVKDKLFTILETNGGVPRDFYTHLIDLTKHESSLGLDKNCLIPRIIPYIKQGV